MTGYFTLATLNAVSLNPENIGKAKPFPMTGVISANQVFYTASGIELKYNPYPYFPGGNVNFDLYAWSVPFSFSRSKQNITFQQTFNKYSIRPTYRWITHFGYTSMSLSQCMINGHIFLSKGVDLAPEGKWEFSTYYRKFQKAVKYDSTTITIEKKKTGTIN